MIVSGECTACRRAFLARGRIVKREDPEWTMEPGRLACSHWPDVLEAINLAAIAPHGSATIGPVRAKRDLEFPPWTIDPPERMPALSEWGLFRDGQPIARLRAHDAETAREL